MARKAKKAEGDAEKEAPAAPKGKTLPAAILAVAILGGAYMLGPGGKSAPAEAGGPAASTTTTTELGAVASLDPITLNLADGRYLKVAIAVQLSAEAPAGGGEGKGDPAAHWARALDAAISVLGERTYDELAAPGGRAKAKEELSHTVAELYDKEVVGVYFTEFVMQ